MWVEALSFYQYMHTRTTKERTFAIISFYTFRHWLVKLDHKYKYNYIIYNWCQFSI